MILYSHTNTYGSLKSSEEILEFKNEESQPNCERGTYGSTEVYYLQLRRLLEPSPTKRLICDDNSKTPRYI